MLYLLMFFSLFALTINADHSVIELTEQVLNKAKKIREEHPEYNNRDLIQKFFEQNPNFKAPKEAPFVPDEHAAAQDIVILGAGPSGLIAAYTLARQGHHVRVYEKRGEDDFSSRWQNVSLNGITLLNEHYPELINYLQENDFLHYEMELNDATKLRSYRVAIGDLQEALISLCLSHNVLFNFNLELSLGDIGPRQIVIIATGTKTLEKKDNQELKDAFNFSNFPEYRTYGVAAISYHPHSQVSAGFHKDRIMDPENGINWGFKIAMAGFGIASQTKRIKHLYPAAKFSEPSDNPVLFWYLYAKKDPDSLGLPFSETIDAHSNINFTPSFATRGAILQAGHPVILWGDARVSSHPLTGAGLTIPFQSAHALLRLVQDFDFTAPESAIERYNQETTPLAQELFIKTLLVTLF